MSTEIVSVHHNSEGKKATIERVMTGDFAGQLIIVIHDDPPSLCRVPMLLDEGTMAWLQRQFVQPVEPAPEAAP